MKARKFQISYYKLQWNRERKESETEREKREDYGWARARERPIRRRTVPTERSFGTKASIRWPAIFLPSSPLQRQRSPVSKRVQDLSRVCSSLAWSGGKGNLGRSGRRRAVTCGGERRRAAAGGSGRRRAATGGVGFDGVVQLSSQQPGGAPSPFRLDRLPPPLSSLDITPLFQEKGSKTFWKNASFISSTKTCFVI